MNTIKHFLLIASLSTSMPILAAEPAPGALTNEAPAAPATLVQKNSDQPQPAPAAGSEAATNAATTAAMPAPMSDLATNAVTATNTVAGTNGLPAASPAVLPVVVENGTNGLRMNFNKAPLNLVLD